MRIYILATAVIGLLFSTSVRADDSGPVKTALVAEGDTEKDWTIELGSGALFGNVRTTGLDSYTLIPVDFTASLTVDEVSLDDFLGGVFRGNTEFAFRGVGMAVAKGVEDRIIGFSVGPRYNFVQKGWVIVPFVGADVGIGFANSQGRNDAAGNNVGLGQDFSFNFGVMVGISYNITDDWFIRLKAYYTHLSNAGLSNPGRNNNAIDNAGPVLSLGYRF